MSKRPGFRREPKLYRLRFEDPDMEGLEVTAKSIKLREFLNLSMISASVQSDPQGAAAEADKMYRQFADVLVSWNLLDDNDDPVPATYEGLADQDMDFVLAIVAAWMEAVASVPNLSPARLSSGGTSLEASLPMEVS